MASKKVQMNPSAEASASAAVAGEEAREAAVQEAAVTTSESEAVAARAAVVTEAAAAARATNRLVVRALKAGFRRAGRAWPAEEVTVSTDEFTEGELAQLLTEPMLVVAILCQEEGQ